MKKILLLSFAFLSTTFYAQISFQEQEVSSFTRSSSENKTADIDGDGDMDIVTCGYDTVDWYENKFPAEGFMPKQTVAVFTGSSYLESIDITDFDGDGDLDVIGANSFGDKLFLAANTDGQGTFGAVQVLKTIDNPSFIKHIDMDHDGDKDLLYKSYGTGAGIYYFENTNQANNYTISHVVNDDFMNVDHDIQVVDFNRDGYPDLFYRFVTGLAWTKNNGSAGFSALTTISSPNGQFYSFDVGDIDNDGDDDLVGHAVLNGNIKLIYKLNDGLGNFAAEQNIRQDLTEITALKLDDVDNDSKLDLVVSIRNTNGDYFTDLVWYKNNGANTFTNMPALDLKVRNIYKINTFQLNNDAFKDVITESNSHRTTTYQNTGTGGFSPAKYPAAANLEASCAVAGDLDGDGNLDIVTSSKDEGKIYWYKKSNTDGTYGNQIIVNHDAASAKEVAVADMDGDGDLDIVSISGPSTSGYYDKVSWYKNMDGLGNFGPQINLAIDGYDSPDGLAVYDVDADGDKDIVTSLSNWPDDGDKIVWFANNGSGTFAAEQLIATGIDGVTALKYADVDNDGDLDLVSASRLDDKVGWFENLNGQGSFGPHRIITSTAQSVSDVVLADLDGDGDNDVVYMSNSPDNDVLWQPNLDGLGNFGTARIINSNTDSNGASALFAADIDNDSDIDIIVGASTKTTWSENLHGQANFEPPKIISSTLSSPTSAQVIDADNDGALDILIASSGGNKVVLFKNQGMTQNTIKGVVRLDFEGNGCDATDTPLPNMLVSTTDGTTTQATVTFRNEYAGQYRLYTGEGSFETSVVTDVPTYYRLSPTSQSATFNGFGNIATADFCIEPITQVNDLSVALYPLGDARPGFDNYYQLVYQNIGTTTLSGQVTILYNNAKAEYQNSEPAVHSQSANTLFFDFENLAPFQSKSATIRFRIFAPPATEINDVLVFNTAITPTTDDYTPDNNTHILNETVIGSYDPNDITCLEGDKVLTANANKYLHYVIRFQNTGTASAINVKVQHQLDQKLDWTTFQLEGMSHSGRTTITDGSQVEFMFKNINLPHRAFNEAASHGYVLFKIKPKANTVVTGDVVRATANIYFDFNPPIVTNTAETTYVDVLGTDSFGADQFVIHPNPAHEQLAVTSNEAVVQLQIFNVLGSKVLEQKNNNVVDISNLEAGVYLITVTTSKGSITKKFIKQ